MASFGEEMEEISNLAIVPYCPSVFNVEPLSSLAISSLFPSEVAVNLTPRFEAEAVRNNVTEPPMPFALSESDSKKRKIRSSKVTGISFDNTFKRVKFPGGRVEYIWERYNFSIVTTPGMEIDEDFTHELLEGWTVESRIRQDGRTKERYFSHTNVRRQFRSIKEVQKFIYSKLEPAQEEKEKAKFEANKREVEMFLAESSENLMNYYGED